jgi:8-oxo-dGTP pyrophosphatase MutT (NUDIX family)
MSSPFKTLSSKPAWSCPYYSIRSDEVQLPDGQTAVYHIVEVPDSVTIVPVLSDGRIVLIRNYRYTLNEWVWEVPAGGIKEGQTPLEAAQMELKEEIGGQTEEWRFLCKASDMSGIGHHYSHFYLATHVNLSETHHEATEVMEIVPQAAADVYRMIHEGQMNDAVSMTALLLAQSHLSL